MSSPIIIAHRAATQLADAPENTIQALGTLKPWVKGVEVDIRPTSDGVAILMHDTTVDRTTNGTGAVTGKTLANIKALTVDIDGASTTVPTLEEMLDEIELNPDIEIVLLDMSDSSTDNRDAMLDAVVGHSIEDKCVVMVRSDTEMANLRAVNSTLKLGSYGATNANVSTIVSDLTTYDGYLIMTAAEAYSSNRDVVGDAQAGGFLGGSSTNNAQVSLYEAKEDGADVVLTDVSYGMKCYCGCGI